MDEVSGPLRERIFSLIIIGVLTGIAYLASRDKGQVPGRLRNAVEAYIEGADDFICGMLGKAGRKYVPFVGTLFIYILFMNLFGLVPFMKSSTSSWSTTLALAICVFVYVQYTGLKELGFGGYVYHLLGRPKGLMAVSVVIPLLLFILHVVSELIRPISLSLRLRSNIWGDDMLFNVLLGFGIKGIPLVLFSSMIAIIAAVVQATVFCLLTTVYFTLVLTHESD